jgi:NADH-quinone oxidoreductase subunit N
MIPSPDDLIRVLPETIWCGFGILLMLLQPFTRNRQVFTFVAILGTGLGTASTMFAGNPGGPAFFGLIQMDGFSVFFHLLVGLVSFLVVLAADSYLEREHLQPAEFYALVLFATAGMGVLSSAQELLTAFIGLEMSSISSYVLAGYRRDSLKSSESAMKYFLLGSFATAFFLYGIALVYGVTGTTILPNMAGVDPSSTLLKLGLALILIGLGFKVALAPFQVWTPDVYEGAPTPVTALFSAGPKAAAFALLLVLGLLGAGRAHHVRRKPWRPGADQRQAHARLQLHRARRLHPGGLRRRHLSRRKSGWRCRRCLRCRAFLSGQLRARKARCLHRRL